MAGIEGTNSKVGEVNTSSVQTVVSSEPGFFSNLGSNISAVANAVFVDAPVAAFGFTKDITSTLVIEPSVWVAKTSWVGIKILDSYSPIIAGVTGAAFSVKLGYDIYNKASSDVIKLDAIAAGSCFAYAVTRLAVDRYVAPYFATPELPPEPPKPKEVTPPPEEGFSDGVSTIWNGAINFVGGVASEYPKSTIALALMLITGGSLEAKRRFFK